MAFDQPSTHDSRNDGRIGILLINLGSPDAATPLAVRRFLIQLLSDRRVVDLPRWAWLPLLHGVIIPRRSAAVARNYKEIWGSDQSSAGAPLMRHSVDLAKGLQAHLDQSKPDTFAVELSMRIGGSSIEQGLEHLTRSGCKKVVILPLYPQYAGATTASALDQVSLHLDSQEEPPDVQLVNDYHDSPDYISALAASVTKHWSTGSGQPDKLLMSFHGLPQATIDAGAPYQDQCEHTANRLASELELSSDQWEITYQSRFGRAKWIGPYTDETLRELANSGTSRVDIICPGFPADCLETLEEIQIRYSNVFLENGGTECRYIPALNSSPAQVKALANIVAEHSNQWLRPTLERDSSFQIPGPR